VALVQGLPTDAPAWKQLPSWFVFGDQASAEWLYESIEIQREEFGLRSLLGAIEAMEGDEPRNDDRTSGL
jgi:hypothetical protein